MGNVRQEEEGVDVNVWVGASEGRGKGAKAAVDRDPSWADVG